MPTAVILAVLLGLGPAYAATSVFYSVGTSTADLKSGSPTVDIASGSATLSVAQPDIIGVGDVITYNASNTAYVSARATSTVYSVITAQGGTPGNVTGATVNSIKRVFNSLSAAVANSSGASYLNTVSLTTGDYQLNWVCYADGADTTQVTVDGYTTGPSNYIRIYTPVSATEVGVSQRHAGTWSTSGYRLEVGGTSAQDGALYLKDEHVRVEGLQVYRNGTNPPFLNDAIYLNTITTGASDFRVYNNILRGTTTASAFHIGIDVFDSGGSGSVLRLKNNIIYDFAGHANAAGMWIEDADFTVYAYSNTVQNTYDGHHQVAGTVIVKNEIAQDTTGVGFSGTYHGASNYNISDDAADAPGANSKNSTAVSFVDKAGDDFHLARGDTAAKESGTSLAADANLPFTDDVDGEIRGTGWDIGADGAWHRVIIFGRAPRLSPVPGRAQVPGGARCSPVRPNILHRNEDSWASQGGRGSCARTRRLVDGLGSASSDALDYKRVVSTMARFSIHVCPSS